MYKLSKSLSTNPEVSGDTDHKKIPLHIHLNARLHLPEKTLKTNSLQQQHLRLMSLSSTEVAGITFVAPEAVHLEKGTPQVYHRHQQRLLLF